MIANELKWSKRNGTFQNDLKGKNVENREAEHIKYIYTNTIHTIYIMWMSVCIFEVLGA